MLAKLIYSFSSPISPLYWCCSVWTWFGFCSDIYGVYPGSSFFESLDFYGKAIQLRQNSRRIAAGRMKNLALDPLMCNNVLLPNRRSCSNDFTSGTIHENFVAHILSSNPYLCWLLFLNFTGNSKLPKRLLILKLILIYVKGIKLMFFHHNLRQSDI